MIKVSVMYANKPNARFDHTYYRDTHMPMVKRLMEELRGQAKIVVNESEVQLLEPAVP